MRKFFKKIINAKASPLTVAVTGACAVATVPAVASDAATTAEALQASQGDPVTIIIQIILGLASLWKMFRKEKRDEI